MCTGTEQYKYFGLLSTSQQNLELIKILHHTFEIFAKKLKFKFFSFYDLFIDSKKSGFLSLEQIDKLTTMTEKTATVLHIPSQSSDFTLTHSRSFAVLTQ